MAVPITPTSCGTTKDPAPQPVPNENEYTNRIAKPGDKYYPPFALNNPLGDKERSITNPTPQELQQCWNGVYRSQLATILYKDIGRNRKEQLNNALFRGGIIGLVVSLMAAGGLAYFIFRNKGGK